MSEAVLGDVKAHWKTPGTPQRRIVYDHTDPSPKKPLADNHKAILNKESRFHGSVKDPFHKRAPMQGHAKIKLWVMKSGHNSSKLGMWCTKGRWKNQPIFSLTLEERATCPSRCQEWNTCYGNNMNRANRYRHNEDLIKAIWEDLLTLQYNFPGGFVIRLHMLGDFYSLYYAMFWILALEQFPAMNIFGYTAHDRNDGHIGSVLDCVSQMKWSRFAMRFSGESGERGTVVKDKTAVEIGDIVCPVETGKTEVCATCALCWNSKREIVFLRH